MSTKHAEALISHDGFRKASYSMNGSNCVEVRNKAMGADIRDTQNRDAGHLAFPGPEWAALVRAASSR